MKLTVLTPEMVREKARRCGLRGVDISRMTYGEIDRGQAAGWLSGDGMSASTKHLIWRLCDEVGVVRNGRHVAVVVPDVGVGEGQRALFCEHWYFKMGGHTFQVGAFVGEDEKVYAGERQVSLGIFELVKM